MEGTLTLDRLAEMRGTPVYSSDGDKIGSVEELFLDDDTGEPEWIGLGTGFFGTKRVLVPIAGADVRDDAVYVPYAKAHVKRTPDLDGDEISQETEAQLYAHYGLQAGRGATADPAGAADTGLEPGTPDSPGDTTEGTPALTRSEEELRVGKREIEASRLRLHKWVETEQVDVPVELRREKARVTREPVDGSVGDREIGDEQIEVTLREEQPVVAKETVAKERIRVDKEVEVGQETVRDEVRKERVDVDDDGLAR